MHTSFERAGYRSLFDDPSQSQAARNGEPFQARSQLHGIVLADLPADPPLLTEGLARALAKVVAHAGRHNQSDVAAPPDGPALVS